VEKGRDGLIVADTNIIFPLFLERPETPLVQAILERDPDWVAPVFWRVEILNVLSNHCKFAELPLGKAEEILSQASEFNFLREGEVSFSEALKLSVHYRISSYDALFVALARSLETVCVTQDRALRKAVPTLTLTIDEFLKRAR
jgi:predicted nucleic acid-binding protein